MFPWQQIIPFTLQALAQALLSPFFWLVVLFIGWQYRRIAALKKDLFGIAVEPTWQHTLQATLHGIIGGLVGSFLMVVVGVSLSGAGIGYLWVLAALLMLISPRFLCFSYAGGIISLVSLIFGRPDIDVPQLMGLVAVLHMVEAVLIWGSGHLGAAPVYTRHGSGRVVGAFNLQKFWPIPIVVLTLITLPPGLPPDVAVAMPDWWPLIRPQGIAEPDEALFVMLPVLAALGYGDLALTCRPQAKSRRSALTLALYSLILLGLSVLASYFPHLAFLPALFGPLGHEYTIKLGREAEMRGRPFYVPPPEGVRILDVVRGTPAARMGLNSGDIILRINGWPVNSRPELASALEGLGLLEIEGRQAGDGAFIQLKGYKKATEPFGVIPVPDEGDEPQVELRTEGWLVRWWRQRRARRSE
ncbi:MAG: hypothetical protein PWP65_1320 [Clostridia bacterium]|nr:hypothetical protein [Clostridia bacterium]